MLSQTKARMTDHRNDLGKMLKGRRLVMRLTLQELSALSGVSTSYLGRIEKGNRLPSARVLQKIAKPLGYEKDEILTHAGYLPPQASTTESETATGRIDPYVAIVLAQEPVEVQGAVLGILSILKFVGKATRAAELPDFREYARQKYPHLDEDLVTMIEDLITRKAN